MSKYILANEVISISNGGTTTSRMFDESISASLDILIDDFEEIKNDDFYDDEMVNEFELSFKAFRDLVKMNEED